MNAIKIKQTMAAIITDSKTDSHTKAKQLIALLLSDYQYQPTRPLLEMLCWLIDVYDRQLCRYSDLPLLIHPLEVMRLTAKYAVEYDCLNLDTLLAAAGHDLLDDQLACYDDIRYSFGNNVANIILGLTDYNKRLENKSQAQCLSRWRTLKAVYLKSLEDRLQQTWAPSLLLIAGADKLDNSRRIAYEARHYRQNIWQRPIEGLAWYYQECAKLLTKNLGGSLSQVLQLSVDNMVSSLNLYIT